MYSLPGCAYCTKGRKLLEMANLPFNEVKDLTPGELLDKHPKAEGYPFFVVNDQEVESTYDIVNLAKMLIEKGLVSSKR